MASYPLKAVEKRFEFDSWFNVNRLGEALFVKDYFIDDQLVEGFILLKYSSTALPGAPPMVTSLWRSSGSDSEKLLRIDFSESESRAAAHSSLLNVLGQFQSPNISRQAATEIGDVAFGAADTAVVVSARANLVIFLASVGRAPVDVRGVATKLDRALTERPPQTEAVLAAAGRRRFRARFAQGAKRVVAGARASIRVDLDEDLTEPPMLRFFTSNGEIFAEGADVIFESDESDDNEVTVYALQRQGSPEVRSYGCQVE